MATGQEHAPPRCIYPKGMDWPQETTVPSCAKHNNGFSEADEYLRFLLGAIAKNVPEPIISSAVRGAMRLAEKRSSNLGQFGFQWEGDVLNIGKKIPVRIELLRTVLTKMARALYFHHYHYQKKLLIPLGALPLFIPPDSSPDPSFNATIEEFREDTAKDMELYPKFGGHQEIFAYQVFESADWVRVNMEFYGHHHAAVVGIFQ